MKDVVRLDVDKIPKKYYNILPDLPEELPKPLNPGTRKPIKPEDLEQIFPKSLIKQEFSGKRYIRIPDEVRAAYMRLGRPTPLYRARHLEKAIHSKAEIYFKREDVSFTGSHKVNTAVAQAYYNAEEGIDALTTETGAGQWGSALSLACAMFNLQCLVFMVASSFKGNPFRKTIMQLYGAKCVSSPSSITSFGKKLRGKKKFENGSLGIAISEAIEVAASSENTNYALGSVLNHVLMHQTVIGQEILQQFSMIDKTPDIMVGCVGGGSNFGGFAFPMIGEKLRRKGFRDTRFVAAEPKEVPSLTKGQYRYDFGDTAGMTPLLKMYTLGKDYMPDPIRAGGLRYHGMAPTVSLLKHSGVIEARAYRQDEVFDAAALFAKTEGIIPAPESSHAIACAIDLARTTEGVICFNLSGHGLLDLQGYQKILGL
ncbi:MAG: TrpB-like pyridoxal phosphate-dependent enzyme [Candidatus Diapherotrites archaeon]|nr:TrpB-like pyridoxal phosphate-dependent enzyme [Candidatus Diapherotrites archaeon]